jgi:hypothetical protein
MKINEIFSQNFLYKDKTNLVEYKTTSPLPWEKNSDYEQHTVYYADLPNEKKLRIGIFPSISDIGKPIRHNVYEIEWGLMDQKTAQVEYTPQSTPRPEITKRNILLLNKILSTLLAVIKDYATTVKRPKFFAYKPSTEGLGSLYNRIITTEISSDPYFSNYNYKQVDRPTLIKKFMYANDIDPENIPQEIEINLNFYFPPQDVYWAEIR